jgi:hypothetical protein
MTLSILKVRRAKRLAYFKGLPKTINHPILMVFSGISHNIFAKRQL